MQQAIRHIFFAGLFAGCVSMVYFIMLVLHIPFFLIIPIVIACTFVLLKWFKKATACEESPGKHPIISFIILAAGLIFISKNIYMIAEEHGGWDAWAMWNYHAKFLADGGHWKTMFQSVNDDHTDYPLMVPSFCGFFIRIFSGKFYTFIPFIFSILITISTVILLFLSLAKKNLIVASVALFFLVTDKFFISQGTCQYADTPLAFFFLCAILSMEYARENRKYIAIVTAFLGCCLWTKNEGTLLTILFFIFYAPTFFKKQNILLTIAGIALPIFTLVVFKLFFAPPNDMVSRVGSHTYPQFFMPDRYKLIYTHFKDNLNANFYYVKITFFIYLLSLIIKRKLPSKNMMLLVTCMLCYCMIYISTFHDLEWQLSTSMDRLMHQLMPAMFYIMALEIADFPHLRWKQKML